MFCKVRFSIIFKDIWNYLILIFILLVTGCTTNPNTFSQSNDTDFTEQKELTAIEVYRDGADFYFKLHQNRQLFYASGYWHTENVQDSHSTTTKYIAPSVVPIQHFSTKPWKAVSVEARRLPVLDKHKWSELRGRLFSSLVPYDKTGLVMNFEKEEYFLFYNEKGDFEATRLVDKPGDYRIKKYVHYDKFIPFALQTLKAFLRDHDLKQKEFVINTGDKGFYSLPLLYVNANTNRFIFFRNMPLQQMSMGKMPGVKTGQVFGHVVRSHLGNIYTRPVSSLFRFVTLFSDTVVTTTSFEWVSALQSQPVPALTNAPGMDLEGWEQYLDTISKHPQTSGSVDFLVDGEEFFLRYIDVISSARKSVHIQTYIFDNDDYALQIADLLRRRSNEGIDVKILLDGFGTITATMKDSSSQPETHIAPVSVREYLEKNSNVNVRQKENPWFTGDHVKSTVVDKEIAFVGGMNIGREYRYDWHDLMMELRGPVVNIIDKEFLNAWSHAGPLGDFGYLFTRASKTSSSLPVADNYSMRILLTSAGNYEIYNAQLEAIRRSKNHIFVQNAYFTNDRLLRELVKARRRGVDVRVVIPLETDSGPITRSNILAANAMLENGIRVYIYPGFSHVKAAIYDGWVCVGSANFDRLSLRINRELNIASSDTKVAQRLIDKLFKPDFQQSPELTEPLPEKWADRLVEIVSDYIF